MSGRAPLIRSVSTIAKALAAGNSATPVAGRVPFDGVITGVSYIPVATITGADTNSRTIGVINKGQAGSGTAANATLALTSGVNAAAFAAKPLTLSGTPADLAVAEGDILAFTSAAVGSGLADPGGLVTITIARS